MVKYIGRCAAPLALAALVAAGACRSDNARKDSTLAADTSLNRQLASADSTAQPQLNDVPNAPAKAPAGAAPAKASTATRTTPRATRPARTGPTTTASGNTVTHNPSGANAGGGAVGMIPAGATLALNSTSRICTNTNKVGDHVTATVAEAVAGSNGATIPAGATVSLTVTELKRSENVRDPIVMEFAVNSVSFGGHTYPLDATMQSASITRVRDEPQSKDVQKVAIGAAVGAIAGRILGKSTKGAVIGGAAGAAAGAATAVATANYSGCIADGGRITIKLNSATQVRA
jgi:hypothetical protein